MHVPSSAYVTHYVSRHTLYSRDSALRVCNLQRRKLLFLDDLPQFGCILRQHSFKHLAVSFDAHLLDSSTPVASAPSVYLLQAVYIPPGAASSAFLLVLHFAGLRRPLGFTSQTVAATFRHMSSCSAKVDE